MNPIPSAGGGRAADSGSSHESAAALAAALKPISMLAEDVLARMHHWAAQSEGTLVEVGAYKGGGTIAMASALRGTGRRLVTVEAGGSNPNPACPSRDILADLDANLRRFGVSEVVTVVPGLFHRVLGRLSEQLAPRSVGLVALDSDGHAHYQLGRLEPFLRPDCRLVIDDVLCEIKGDRLAAFFAAARSQGALVDGGTYGFGTWFGRLAVPQGLEFLTRWERYVPETGRCWLWPIDAHLDCDSLVHPQRSVLRIFEDGTELGPPHAPHDQIRHQGRGAFSHWIDWVFFSTSDGTDPNRNGRRYEYSVGPRGPRLPMA